jgi:hypothetical protein
MPVCVCVCCHYTHSLSNLGLIRFEALDFQDELTYFQDTFQAHQGLTTNADSYYAAYTTEVLSSINPRSSKRFSD